jgi:hypothetical protein
LADDAPGEVRRAAEISVGRAVGFGALAIGCVVLGLASFPVLALRSGAALTMLMAAILLLHALRAPARPFRRTEVWLILGRPQRLSPALAQRLIGTTLRDVLQRYAGWSAGVAVLLWLASLAWRVLDQGSA